MKQISPREVERIGKENEQMSDVGPVGTYGPNPSGYQPWEPSQGSSLIKVAQIDPVARQTLIEIVATEENTEDVPDFEEVGVKPVRIKDSLRGYTGAMGALLEKGHGPSLRDIDLARKRQAYLGS